MASFSTATTESNFTSYKNHMPLEYLITEENYFYKAAILLRLVNQPQISESQMNSPALIDDDVD